MACECCLKCYTAGKRDWLEYALEEILALKTTFVELSPNAKLNKLYDRIKAHMPKDYE